MRRKWAAVGFGTLLSLATFWMLVGAVLAQDDESGLETNVGVLLSVGLMMIPVVMAGIAYVSKRPNWIRASLFAGAIAFAITVWLPFVTNEPVTPVVVGLGAGAVIALRIEKDHSIPLRAAVVGMLGVYVWIMVQVSVGAGMLLGPLLPIAAIGAADAYSVRRAERDAANRDASNR